MRQLQGNCAIGQLVLRGTRIVLPSKLRSQAISLAHEGHLGTVGTKRSLRSKVWWPGIDKAADLAMDVNWLHAQIHLSR